MTVTWNAQIGDVALDGPDPSWVPALLADAGKASMRVQAVFQGGSGNLWAALHAWDLAIAAVFNPINTAQRTVLNWIARGVELEKIVPQTNETQIHANLVSMFLWECLEAAYYAYQDGRITPTQAIQVGNAFTAIWGV